MIENNIDQESSEEDNLLDPIAKATLNVPVTNQEIRKVSNVPIILQLIDLNRLRNGFSEFTSEL